MTDFSSDKQPAPSSIALVKGLHQYYRDCLSGPESFPNLGGYPPELIEWVIDRGTTDVIQLAEFMDALPRTTLPPEQDLAMRLMLFTIVHANLASDHHNRYPGYNLPPSLVGDIKKGLGRILELQPTGDYIAICVQLLYRIKEIEEVLHLSEDYPDIFARYSTLQAITGFIHTMLGNDELALRYLQPLAEHPANRNLPLVGLSVMTCQYRLGMVPQWPVSFDSVKDSTERLPELVQQLPPLQMLQPLAETPRPVVFVACDTRYFFEHAVYLAYSIHAENKGKLDLHLHLYAPEPRVLDEIERLRARLPEMAIGVSAESGPAPLPHAPAYYATARFVRAWQVMQQYRCELCLMDADALFNADWERLASRFTPQTELALVRPAAVPFWEQVPAGFLYCRPTPLAENYLAKVAQFILHNIELKRVVWFTDQIALSVSYDMLGKDNPAVCPLPAELVIDTQHRPEALCWMVTTIKSGNPAYDAARQRLAQRYS
jgi:hypothetical protein